MPKVKVGVAWRRDGNNQAHLGDLAVFNHEELTDDVEVYTLDWHGAPTANGLRKGPLSDMDLLVIPGGPHANATQIPVVGQAVDNAPQGNTATYATNRATSELNMIEQARTLGMPILALCGGSWRLVQNYGGSTVEVAALGADGRMLVGGSTDANRTRHAGPMNNVATQFKHPLSITTGTLVENATGRTPLPKSTAPLPPQMQVNSVHWAVVRTASMGVRNGLNAQPFEVVPNNLLKVSAKDPSALGTSEAVESQHGAPVIGVQWHPEYQLPQTGGQQTQSRLANLNLLRWMIEAGRAYRVHRNAMQKVLDLFGGGQLKTASGVQFQGAPVHTGDRPGAPPPARAIPQHKDDTLDTTGFAKAEMAVRRYLFGLGRKGKLFLMFVEVFNLSTGAPLPRLHEPEDLRPGPVITFMKANVWAQKYCNEEAKQAILQWPKT